MHVESKKKNKRNNKQIAKIPTGSLVCMLFLLHTSLIDAPINRTIPTIMINVCMLQM